MNRVTSRRALAAALAEARAAGRRIAFVPTMGYLHEGHLALCDEAAASADFVVMSVFVNPLQFGPGEDFERYPRDLERDAALAAGRGVDLLFAPDVADMYPAGETRVFVTAGDLEDRLCGAYRPGHFRGVLTVVAKLFHLVEPEVACFGQKDIQQVTLVRRMIVDLDWPLRLSVVPTVREPDGLALSSRNVYLSAQERAQALGLSRALDAARAAFAAGERRAARLEARMREVLAVYPGVAPDYISIVEPDRLEPVETAASGTVVAIAARVGKTRLIDNLILGEP